MAGVLEGAKLFKQKNNLAQDTVSFVLSGGDNVSGADVNKNEFVMDLLQNEMGVDASGVGNNEIYAKSDGLREFAK